MLFIKLLAGIAARGIPLVIFILETGGRGFAAWPGIGFPAAAAGRRPGPRRASRRAASARSFVGASPGSASSPPWPGLTRQVEHLGKRDLQVALHHRNICFFR